MSNNSKGINLSTDAWAVALTVSIDGVETQSEIVEKVSIGDAIETEKRVNERIANEEQYEAAKALRNKLRACITKHTHHVEPLGNLTNLVKVEALRAEYAWVETLVAAHNGQPDQQHRINATLIALPIGQVITPEAQARICEVVREELMCLKRTAEAKDVKKLAALVNQRKNLASLMPDIVGRAVQGGIDAAKQALHLLREQAAGKLPDTIPADLSALDAALAWVDHSLLPVVGGQPGASEVAS